MAQQPTPRWHPVSAIPLIAQALDGMVEAAEPQERNLQQAQQRPYSLDDALVQRVIRVFTTQANDLWVYDEQLTRWRKEKLSAAQGTEIERLTQQLARLREVIQRILQMAEGLKHHTIERLLEKDDVEVALDFLTGKLKR